MTPEMCEAQFVRLMSLVREGRNLSQLGLAERLGKSRSVVSFFESGRRPLKASEFPAWAAAIGVDAEDIQALRLFSFGYRPWGDEWSFWLDFEDPEASEYGADDPVDFHAGMASDLADLLNRMAGKEICERSSDEYSPELNILLHSDYGQRTFLLRLPKEPFLGDPNNEQAVQVQGTREDLAVLLEACTDEQIALTTAFIRGLHAQARSRLRTRKTSD